MCRFPLTIVNPSRYVDIESCQPLYITVPCGHCSECQQSSKNEWLLRLYYEQLGAFNRGDFCIFDTLTYSPDNLPYLHDFVNLTHLDNPASVDFPCFSARDIQLFNKRLRFNLPKGVEYRYFLVSEYGHDFGQKVPCRPHYHVLFFVHGDISPFAFSALVSKSWSLGRTDGIPFRTSQYVQRNVFRSVDAQIPKYVLKYVTKSAAYNDLVRSRLDTLFNCDKEVYLAAKKFVRQFHLQSLSFGYKYLLDVYTPEQLVHMASLRVLDSHGYRHIPFPASLKRKVFYKVDRSTGRVRWIPLPLLVSYNLATLKDRIAKLSHQFTNFLAWSDCVKLSEYVLLKRFRLQLASADVVYSTQSNTDCSGFRNYSARDRLFKYKIFANQDFGSAVDGYKTGFTLTYNPFSSAPFEFSRLDDVEKCMYVDDFYESVLSKVQASKVGDPAYDVNKLKDRIINKFKMLQLC